MRCACRLTTYEAAEKVYISVGLYGEEFVEVTGGDLQPGDDISTTYEAADKKSSAQKNNRMGPPPRF